MTTLASAPAQTAPPPAFSGEVEVIRDADDPHHRHWFTVQDIRYRDGTSIWIAPEGTRTDFASVPRVFTWFVPRIGRFDKAAIIHDKLCDDARAGLLSRAEADAVFLRALRDLEIALLRRLLMWAGVRLGGLWRDVLRKPKPVSPHYPMLIAVAIPGAVFGTIPVAVILAFLVAFWAVENIVFAVLSAVAAARGAPASVRPSRPRFPWWS